MKQILIIFFLIIFSGSVFGQYLLSKDALGYIKNEKRYNKKSYTVIKDILKKTNENFFIDYYYFKTIPTFKTKEKYLTSEINGFIKSLRIDKNILWNEILILHQPNKNFKYYVGCTFCESTNCNLYLDCHSSASQLYQVL